MAKAIRNLDYIREKDARLYEALADLIQQHRNLAQQVNGNSTGQPLPPPPIDGVTVTGQNGSFHVQIQHRAEFYRGVQYYAEYASNPGFRDPHTIHMGDVREKTLFLGNGTYYWRAYAAYSSSPPSAPAYHGGAASPQPVAGGGGVGGPAHLPPQGSGTGAPGEGLSGPGPIPFRSSTGAPPIRGKRPARSAGGSSGGSLAPSPATGLPAGASVAPASGGASATGFRFLTSTQANLAALAATLGVLDSNQVLVWVTDYDHTLIWTGTAWKMIDDRSGYIRGFLVDPSPTTGWHLCDGSAVSYMNQDGSLTAGFTLPDLVSVGSKASFILLGSAASVTLTAAVAPTLAMNPYTPTGTNSAPIFTGSAMGIHAHELPIQLPATGLNSISQTVFGSGTTRALASQIGGAVLGGSAAVALSQAVSAGTPAGTVSAPTFTGNSATLTGAISNTGTPQSIQLRPWFRL